MRAFRLICFLLLWFPLCASALDRGAFRFSNYDLQMNVDPAAHALSVRGTLTAQNISETSQSAISLQISSTLDWRLINVDGRPAEYVTQPFTTDIDHTGSVSEAVVTLPQKVAPGTSVTIEYGYSGTITADSTRLTRRGAPQQAAERVEWDGISAAFTAVRGAGYVAWYPVEMEAANLSENRLFLTLGDWRARESQASMRGKFCWIADVAENDESHEEPPMPNLRVVANGTVESMGQAGTQRTSEGLSVTGCSTYTFDDLGLITPAFVIGEFDVLNRPAVTVYYKPEDKERAQDYALAVEEAVPFVAEWFGSQRRKVQIIGLNQPEAEPYESGAALFTPIRAANSSRLELALVREVTHAYFSSWRPWIDEGLAQFAQALWLERKSGRRAALEFMRAQLPALAQAEKQACGTPAASTGDDGPSSSSSSSQPARRQPTQTSRCAGGRSLAEAYDQVYTRVKGMYVWWMLRDIVGDAALQRVIRDYNPRQDQEPSYVQRLVAGRSSRNPESFFDDWVYRDRGLPDFRIVSVYPRATLSGSYVVTVTVENLGGAGAEVPVRVVAGPGEENKTLELQRNSTGVTRIQISATPVEAVVNDGSVPEFNMENNSMKVAPPSSQP